MLRNMIDCGKLIEEVKKRPALYDNRAHGCDQNARKIHWEEVTKEVYNEVYDSSDNKEKEALVKETQIKWKTLRDSYNRLRKQVADDELKGVTKNRKKPTFYDQLTFLEGFVTNRSRALVSNNAVYIQEEEERIDDSMDNTNFSDSVNFFKVDEEQLYDPNTSTIVQPSVQPIGNRHENARQPETNERVSDILQELVKIQQEDRKDDRMGNKKFLLSLLPFMQKLPDDVNLEVRLQIMSVIQTYANSN